MLFARLNKKQDQKNNQALITGKIHGMERFPETQSEINSEITLGHPKLGKVEKLTV